MDNETRFRKPKAPAAKQLGFAAAVILGRDIQQHRIANDMSQRVLARKIGTTQAHIARIESGDSNPTLKMLVRIAAAFEQNLLIGFRDRPR